MLRLYRCLASAYTKHMYTPGALNIPDMIHISICSGEKKHENRIDI
ncbi:toxin-antitoxin system, antitoxin component, AbrB family protein [Escherichia coli]|uniref:Toxin-antitoxin system, antitoxin component, AbrB family protein n=1 Tax=Escherichia coli TaxID=562 RepID=A0A3R0MZE8_ECOLX|nr:toxin-antitoxin system, antitoxin component, AbrB family protein [Escherichia coli]EFW7473994.1 toxin-antitoxin system, antitoxin component, AbrB family protein [Shigella sonnei]EAB0392294.1 toxin-antitoxin system, antitoxin component, AbrB family protein [Escherichia coli]EEV5596826.1 toxin-antitoxin system, antitoxin component, AbrB family protein [Escherichia coli]EEW3678718.1 toxin-antitoxin system, antitoxin component, AbrB family protein [Escherichia coli]